MSTIARERKSQRLVARVSKSHKRLFERAAAIEGRSVAVFVVTHAVKAAEELLRNQEVIRLNVEQSRRFAEALLISARPVPQAFRRAHKDYHKRVLKEH